MVDISSFQSQVTQARQGLEQRRRELSQAESQVEQQRKKLQSQQVIRSTSVIQRQKASAQIGEQQAQIRQGMQELSEFESSRLSPAEQSISEISQAERTRQQVEAIRSGKPIEYSDLTKEARQFLKSSQQQTETNIQRAIAQAEESAQSTLTPEARQDIINQVTSGRENIYLDMPQSSILSQNQFTPISTEDIKLQSIARPSDLTFRTKFGEALTKPEAYIQKGLGFIEKTVSDSGQSTVISPRTTFLPVAGLFSESLSKNLRSTFTQDLPKTSQINKNVPMTEAPTIMSSNIQSKELPENINFVNGRLVLSPKQTGILFRTGLDVASFVNPTTAGVRTTSFLGGLTGKIVQGQKLTSGEKIAGGLFVAAPLYSKVSSLLGYPKFSTASVSRELEGNNFRTIFQTTQKNLVTPSKQFIGGAESKIVLFGDGEVTPFITGSKGIVYTKNIELGITGKVVTKYGSPTGFGAVEYGEITRKPISFSGKSIDESFIYSSAGKTKQLGKAKDYYLSQGVGGMVTADKGFILSRSKLLKDNKIINKGEDISLGIIKRDTKTIYSTGGQVVSTQNIKKSFIEQQLKSPIAQVLKAKTAQSIKKTGQALSGVGGITLASKPTSSLEYKSPTSIYQGQGTYERTEQAVSFKPISFEVSRENIIQRSSQGQVSSQQQALVLKEDLKVLPKEAILQRVPKRQITGLSFSQSQRQDLLQKLLQRQIQKNKNIPKQKSPINKVLIKIGGDQIKSSGASDFGLGDVQPQLRRFGKWIDIGTPQSFGLAKIKAISEARRSLGASFRLKKGEDVLDINELPSDFTFSKRDKKVGVQLRGKRLSARSEVKEIFGFKRRSRR